MTLADIRRDIVSRKFMVGTCRYVEPSAPSTSAICGRFDYDYPTCRCCGDHVCEKHYDTATLRTTPVETESGSAERKTVYCGNCLDAYGPEEE